MSETLIETASAYQAEDRVYEPENHAVKASGVIKEVKDPSWGDKLTEFIGANAQVIIECEWMGSAKVALGEAMSFYPWPPNMTQDDIPSVMAVVLEHVTNRRAKAEPLEVEPEKKPAEIETADQKSEIETESLAVQANSNKSDKERQPETESEDAKVLGLPISQSAGSAEPQASYVLAVEAEQVAEPAAGEPKQSIQGPGKNAAPATISNKSAARAEAGDTSKTVQELAPIPASADIKLSETAVVIKPSIEAKVPKPVLEIPEPAAEADPVVELKAALDRSAVDAGQEIEAPVLLEILDEVPAPKLVELSTSELESVAATEDAQEFYELDISSIPAWEAATNIGETGEEQPALYINNEPKLSVDLESTDPEQLVRTSLPIEEIEDSLIQLAEHIEASEPETTERVNEILDKIIDVPAKLEAYDGESIITEAQAQEELEELFTELFKKMGIDYTPKLIESLATLTLKWHLVSEIEKLRDEKETEAVPKASDPHVIIKRLLVSLSNIKKAMAHACAIGKFALALYSFNYVA